VHEKASLHELLLSLFVFSTTPLQPLFYTMQFKVASVLAILAASASVNATPAEKRQRTYSPY
jgi:hypothetical protein